MSTGNRGADPAAPWQESEAARCGIKLGIEQIFGRFVDLDLIVLRRTAIAMSDRRMQFSADIGRDNLAHAAGADQQIDFQTGGRRADNGQVPHLATDERTDDGHRMVHGAESSDDDDIAIPDEGGGFFVGHQHLLARRPIGARDRFQFHVFVPGRLNNAASFSLTLPTTLSTTRELIGGGSLRVESPEHASAVGELNEEQHEVAPRPPVACPAPVSRYDSEQCRRAPRSSPHRLQNVNGDGCGCAAAIVGQAESRLRHLIGMSPAQLHRNLINLSAAGRAGRMTLSREGRRSD